MTRKVQKGPSERIAHHLSALAAANTTRAGDQQRNRRAAAPRAFGDHRQERRRIGDLHQPVDVAGRLHAAARPLRAFVAAARRASTSMKAKTTTNRTTSDTRPPSLQVTSRAYARSQSPARAMTARRTPGASRAANAAASMPRGEATSARSARLKRHFPANSRRRSAASRAWTPVHPCSSACSAAVRRQLAAADREAQAVAGHRIDEPRRVAGEQQSIDGRARRRRPPADRGRPAALPGARRQTGRAASDRPRARASAAPWGPRSARSPAARRSHEADVGQSAGHRRDADVAIRRTCISPKHDVQRRAR